MGKENRLGARMTMEYLIYIVLLLLCIAVLFRLVVPKRPTVIIDMPALTVHEILLEPDPLFSYQLQQIIIEPASAVLQSRTGEQITVKLGMSLDEWEVKNITVDGLILTRWQDGKLQEMTIPTPPKAH